MGKRAILSVYNKTGLVALARHLAEVGFELVASGGTQRLLAEAGLPVVAVSDITGAPEILGGRVKTLHPAVHGGILARGSQAHLDELAAQGYGAVDLVVCNLYPFAQTVARPDVTEAAAVEEIDIGGVTLLRAAAKNFERVTVLCDPADYEPYLELTAAGEVPLAQRRGFALKAFRHTAAYDANIATWLASQVEEAPLPEALNLAATRVEVLRYGENPHQQAALYRWVGAAPAFEQLQGKALSYNNIVDLEAAWQIPGEFSEPAVAIIKHTNPCGLALGSTLVEAYGKALESDPVSAFGSIIAVNREVEVDLVEAVGKLFVEVLVAPSYSNAALEMLARRKPGCRVMLARAPAAQRLTLRSLQDGLLVQTADDRGATPSQWTVVSERQPTEAELAELAFAWLAAKHIKSNAIVMTQGRATVGVGAGQMNRVESVRLAARQAGERARGAALGSDAFFPFADGVEEAAAAGVTAVVQPGGSIRDEDVIAAANRLGLAMVFTGERHFRH